MPARKPMTFKEGREKKLGGGAGRLRDWKKDGSIVIFIQTSSGLTPRLFHLVPYIGEDDKGKAIIRYYPFVCHEDPEQYLNRVPPQHCPICRAIDILADDGRIDEDELIWDASIGNRQKDRFANKLDFCQLDKTADWKNSFKPAVQYVFVAVDTEKLSDGLVVAVEPQTVGQSISSCVTKEIDAAEGDEGDPEVNPYAFKLTYDPDALPKDKYDAYAFRKVKYSDEIAELIESDPVDLSNWINPGNSARLLEIFKEHFKADIDLDILFDEVLDPESYKDEEDEESQDEPEEKLHGRTRSPMEDTSSSESESSDGLCETCNGNGTIGKKKVECPDCGGTGFEGEPENPEEAEDEGPPIEMNECDTCGGKGTIGKKKVQCPDCDGEGTVEAEEETAPEPEPTPPPKSSKKDGSKKGKGTKGKGKGAKGGKGKGKGKGKAKEKPPEPEETVTMFTCGSCQRKIPADVNMCPHCGTEFEDDEGE